MEVEHGIPRRPRRKPLKSGRKRTPKTAAREQQIVERRSAAAKLRIRGRSIRAIADELGCSVGTVHSDLDAEFTRTLDESRQRIERSRELSLRRLDAATEGIWPKVEKGNPEATRALVRLEERRAKLEGHDVSTKLELSGPNGGPVELVEAKTGLARKLDDLKTRLRSVPPPAS